MVPTSFKYLVWLAMSGAWLLATFSDPLSAQTPPPVEPLRKAMTLAEDRYRDGKIDEAVDLLNRTASQLQELVKQTDNPRTLAILKGVHGALTKVYQRLELDGIVLPPLPDWKTLEGTSGVKGKGTPKSANPPPSAPNGQVSFATDVAPWLVSKCGRCHINDTKGGFSMATLGTLIKGSKDGAVIIPRDAEHSRLVEVIVSGDMPRGGGKVTPMELDALKKWIDQGVPFDPAKASAPLASMVSRGNATATAAPAKGLEVRKPTGKETVSFAKDIAPILMANCNGCHYDAQQRSGDLTMDTFARIARGGESGSMIEAGKPNDSLLVKKIKGLSGDRMPAGGRPALASSDIDKIATWIAEGATFDGDSPDANLEGVAAKAWAAAATPAEMAARRMERAKAKWKVAFENAEPEIASEGEFTVLGNVGQQGIQNVLKETSIAWEKVRKALRLSDRTELAKGGITVFVVKNRYDYSEFGKMTESRTLPPQWSAHWRRETLDVYIVLLDDPRDPKALQANLVQQLASLWISSARGTPVWYANGFGRGVYAMLVGRNDAKVRGWDQQTGTIIGGMKSTKDLIEGRMNEEDAAIVGYYLTRKMIDSPARKPFDAILRGLEQSSDFDRAFTQAIGPFEPTVAAALGIQSSKGKAK